MGEKCAKSNRMGKEKLWNLFECDVSSTRKHEAVYRRCKEYHKRLSLTYDYTQ